MKSFFLALIMILIGFSGAESSVFESIVPKIYKSSQLSVQSSIKVSLGVRSEVPTYGDLWLVCEQGSGYYHYQVDSQKWILDSNNLNVNEIRPSYTGQLFTFSPIQIGFNGLSGGRSIFYFAFDRNANGKIDEDVVIKVLQTEIAIDCLVAGIEQLQDNGAEGRFRITLNYSSLDGFTKRFVRGQSYPDGPWIEYGPIGNLGQLELNWPNGKSFEFSYGVDGVNWIDPTCSQFLYNGHLKVILGEEKVCSQNNTGDSIVTGIYDMGSGKKRIYLNLSSLPFNYQSVFIRGQSAPNRAWVNYQVVNDFPCYYFDISNWPSGQFMEFSFGVIKEDGSEQWIDPLDSQFFYNGHLRLRF